MSYRYLIFEPEEQLALLQLNRPEKHHAIHDEMIRELEDVLAYLEAHPAIRVLVLSATGRETFCAGGDLGYFASLQTRDQVAEMSLRMARLLSDLGGERRVLIAAVNGQALGGGCEILAYAHLRLAAEHASFAFRQVRNGIVTGWGGGSRWLAMLGPSGLAPFLFSGQRFSAQKAREIGLVHEVVPFEQLIPRASEWAEEFARCSRAALKGFLSLQAKFIETRLESSLVELEHNLFLRLWQAPDFQNVLNRYGSEK